jgi:2-polyprenyl-3-methyl-5-hydroxy-6-metoxy-1,4-benzoquinol methylase
MSAASKLPTSGATNSGNARFNAEAAAWDANPFVHTASKHACDAILKRFPELSKESPTYDVLEIGCGTGLLSLSLAPYTRNYVAVDAAEGMIEVLKRKVASVNGTSSNVKPIAALLEDPEDARLPPADSSDSSQTSPRLKYDLITSHLVLHHIPDLHGVLTTMLGCLKPGTGRLALTDFEDCGPHSKRFHSKAKMEGVERHGIPRKWMAELLTEVGFVDVKVEEGFRMEKRVEKWEGEFSEGGGDGKVAKEGMGEVVVVPFLLCEGRRP